MRITSFWLVAVVGAATLSLAARADAQDTAFRIVSTESKECLHLRAPDSAGGGGLEMKPCQPLPDFAFSLNRSTTDVTQIIVKLTSSRFVCVVATDDPITSIPKPLPVTTVDCGGLGSLWRQRGPLDQRVIEKADRTQTSTNACLQVSPSTGQVELEICQPVPRQQWKLELLP